MEKYAELEKYVSKMNASLPADQRIPSSLIANLKLKFVSTIIVSRWRNKKKLKFDYCLHAPQEYRIC